MNYRFVVKYHVKRTNKEDVLFGLLLDEQVRFPTFQGAVDYMRRLQNNPKFKSITGRPTELVGLPVVEQV
jgi:hypothetical protein